MVQNYKGYVIVLRQEDHLAIFVGKIDDPILRHVNSSIVAVRDDFPDLDLPEKIVLHGWYTDKDRYAAVEEIKAMIDNGFH